MGALANTRHVNGTRPLDGTGFQYGPGSDNATQAVPPEDPPHKCTNSTLCPHGGAPPRDGAGEQKGRTLLDNAPYAGPPADPPRNCTNATLCPYGGVPVRDGTGLQYRGGRGNDNATDSGPPISPPCNCTDPTLCPYGGVPPRNGTGEQYGRSLLGNGVHVGERGC